MTAARPRGGKSQRLHDEILDFKGKGKGKSKGKNNGKNKQKNKGKPGASEHEYPPRSFDDMSPTEKRWLGELWNGNLRRRVQDTKAKCEPVQAKRFRV